MKKFVKIEKFGKKVVLVGDGSVGSGYAFAVMTQGAADEFVIIDIAKDKVETNVKDLNRDALYSSSPVTVKTKEYEDCKDADLVVATAGASRKPGETHLQLTGKNTKIIKSIMTSVMDSDSDDFFLIAANSADILTRYVKEAAGLPVERAIGSGIALDSARFRYLISKELGVTSSSVHAGIIGEHSDSELAVWSQTDVEGISAYDILKEEAGSDAKANEIYTDTRDATYDIIQVKGSMYYGIALAPLHIPKALLNSKDSTLTVSSQFNGQHRFNDVYLGLPTLINQNGVAKIYKTPLNNNELQLLEKSVKTLENTCDSIKHLV